MGAVDNEPMFHHSGFAGEKIDLHPLFFAFEDLADGAPFHGELCGNIFLAGLWVILGEDADELAVHVSELRFCLLTLPASTDRASIGRGNGRGKGVSFRGSGEGG